MTRRSRRALAQVAAELRAGQHTCFNIETSDCCIGSLLRDKLEHTSISLHSTIEQITKDPDEIHQLRILFFMAPTPDNVEINPRDQSAAADRIDNFLKTGKVWS